MKLTPQEYANMWLNSEHVSLADKATIRSLSTEAINRYFSDQPLKFGTAGIRAKMGVGWQQLNQFVYQQLAAAYAEFLIEQFPNEPNLKVIIVHDNRTNGDQYAWMCARVLASYHIQVHLAPNNHLLATPIISYWIRKLQAHGGINITASHNPKSDNGFKAYNFHGIQVSDQESAIIEAHFPECASLLKPSVSEYDHLITYLPSDCCQTYFASLKPYLTRTNPQEKKTFPVLYTPHHGVGANTMVELIHDLGYVNFQQLPCESDVTGDYPNEEITNPEDKRSFIQAINVANSSNINYLMATDPDGDRMAFAEKQKNGQFHFFNGNENGILLTHYLLTTRKFDPNWFVVSSYVSNNFVDKLLTPHQIPVHRTGTGFKWISQVVETQISQGKSLLIAFEEAIGATVMPINREKDGYQLVSLALEMIDYYQQQNLLLTDVLKQLYQQYGHWFGTTESYIIDDLDWKAQLQAKLALVSHYDQKAIGGLQIAQISWNSLNQCWEWLLAADCWVRFRISGTEPKFKIYYNLYAANSKALMELYQNISNKLQAYLGLGQ